MTPKPAEAAIEAFVEGATEVAVLRGLRYAALLPRLELRAGGQGQKSGKEAVLAALRLKVSEWAKLPEAARSPLRILVVLDQDHGTIADGVDLVRGALVAAGLTDAQLAQEPAQDRVYVLKSPSPKLRLSLHIAGNPAVCKLFPALSQRSTDDDVLLLAMDRTTAAAMLSARHASRQKLGVDRLLEKVRTELPALMAANGLAPFLFAKDHIRFYAAVLGTSTSPAAFAETVVKHSSPEALRAGFAPLLAACQALQG